MPRVVVCLVIAVVIMAIWWFGAPNHHPSAHPPTQVVHAQKKEIATDEVDAILSEYTAASRDISTWAASQGKIKPTPIAKLRPTSRRRRKLAKIVGLTPEIVTTKLVLRSLELNPNALDADDEAILQLDSIVRFYSYWLDKAYSLHRKRRHDEAVALMNAGKITPYQAPAEASIPSNLATRIRSQADKLAQSGLSQEDAWYRAMLEHMSRSALILETDNGAYVIPFDTLQESEKFIDGLQMMTWEFASALSSWSLSHGLSNQSRISKFMDTANKAIRSKPTKK